jgi:hypothetical protein
MMFGLPGDLKLGQLRQRSRIGIEPCDTDANTTSAICYCGTVTLHVAPHQEMISNEIEARKMSFFVPELYDPKCPGMSF